MTNRATAAIVAIVICAPGLCAQAPPFPLQRLAAFDAKEVESVERGEALTITLESADKAEIATLGIVKLDVPRAFYLEHARELTGFLESGMRASAGVFSEPARLEDVAQLALDPSDAKALQKCKPLSCDVKLSAEMMEKFRLELGKSHEPAPGADSIMRQWIVGYVNAYRADSSEELVVFDDTKRPVRSSDAFRSLLAEPMPVGIDSQPFAQMLAGARGARPPEMKSRISWEIDRQPGLKPTLEVLERSMYSSPEHPNVTWMATKQLYASHYFESQINFIAALDGEAVPGRAATYLVILRRQKFDDLPSGGLFNIRGRAVKKLREGLRTALANTRVELSKAYAERGSGHERTP